MNNLKSSLKSREKMGSCLATFDASGSSPDQFLQLISQLQPASAAAISKVLDHCVSGDVVEAMLLTQMVLTHTVIVENIEARAGLMADPDALKNAASFIKLFNQQVEALKRYRHRSGPSININNILAGHAIKTVVDTAAAARNDQKIGSTKEVQ